MRELTNSIIQTVLSDPDIVVRGHKGRRIAQKMRERHGYGKLLIRVVYEERVMRKSFSPRTGQDPKGISKGKKMKVEYDKDLDIMYIKLKDGKYAFTEEVNDNALLDLDPEGRILALEIHDVSSFLGQKLLRKTLKAEAALLT